jgi:hypothetical protein
MKRLLLVEVDALDEHCGPCPLFRANRHTHCGTGRCTAFGKNISIIGRADTPLQHPNRAKRLPECLAAEAAAKGEHHGGEVPDHDNAEPHRRLVDALTREGVYVPGDQAVDEGSEGDEVQG